MFAIDISCLVEDDHERHQRLQHLRSTGELSAALSDRPARDDVFGDRVDEKARIMDRMERVDREGGVLIWSRRFLDSHSPWLETNPGAAGTMDSRAATARIET